MGKWAYIVSLAKRLLFYFIRRKVKEYTEEHEEEEEVETEIQYENYSGRITIDFESDTGNFTVETDIRETSIETVTSLGGLIFLLSEGTITPYIYEALGTWAGSDDERIAFNEYIATYINTLTREVTESRANMEEDDEIAVDASRVFNFKGLYDRE